MRRDTDGHIPLLSEDPIFSGAGPSSAGQFSEYTNRSVNTGNTEEESVPGPSGWKRHEKQGMPDNDDSSYSLEAKVSGYSGRSRSWKDAEWSLLFEEYLLRLQTNKRLDLQKIQQSAESLQVSSMVYEDDRKLWAVAMPFLEANFTEDSQTFIAMKAAMLATQGYHGIMETVSRSGAQEWRITFYSGLPLVLPHRVIKWIQGSDFPHSLTRVSPQLLSDLKAIFQSYLSFGENNPQWKYPHIMGFTLLGKFPNDILPWLSWENLLGAHAIVPESENQENELRISKSHCRLESPGDSAYLYFHDFTISRSEGDGLYRIIHRSLSHLFQQNQEFSTANQILDMTTVHTQCMDALIENLSKNVLPDVALVTPISENRSSETGSVNTQRPYPSDLLLDATEWVDSFIQVERLLRVARLSQGRIGNGNTPENVPRSHRQPSDPASENISQSIAHQSSNQQEETNNQQGAQNANERVRNASDAAIDPVGQDAGHVQDVPPPGEQQNSFNIAESNFGNSFVSISDLF